MGYNYNQMSVQTDTIIKVLSKLGLSDEEVRVYLDIAEKTYTTALQVSKDLQLGRTKVYRILDKLHECGLTDQRVGSRGFIFEAQPFENIERLILGEESRLSELKSSLPLLVKQLKELQEKTQKSREYKVLYYEGKEGVRQVTWNSTKAKDQLFVYEVDTMNTLPGVGMNFAEKVREKVMENQRLTKSLTNRQELKSFTKNYEYADKYWDVRRVDPKFLKIAVETLVYNDVVAMYHTDAKEPFCVEIYNPRLAQMQKQIFDFIWSKAHRMKKIKPGGACKLV